MKQNYLWMLLAFLLALGIWGFQHRAPKIPQVAPASASTEISSETGEIADDAMVAENLAVLNYKLLPEASGLAVSGIDPRRLWMINDSGSRSELVALDLDTQAFQRVNILDTPNLDWEDLESFAYRGAPWLAVADVGDNKARRDHVTLYFLPEPGESDDRVKTHSTIELSYPDGPRDVESVAVDPRTETLYLLSKRDEFPRLYALRLPDLRADRRYQLQAELLGEIRSIPAPTPEDLRLFSKYGKYRNQPTAMSHVPDGSGIALLTYGNTFFSALGAERDWLKALNKGLCPVPRPEMKQAESISADAQGRLYVTSEGKNAPVLRLTPPAECQLKGF